MALLEVRGLVKYYGKRCVVSGVDFEVNAGEVVGLLGPNGAGKTTSFRMTTGQIVPHRGTVWFNGQEITSLLMYERARIGMGYLPQEHSIFRGLNVEQNILAILELVPSLRSLNRAPTRSERWELMEAMLHRFGLVKVRKNLATRLSGGEKRRLEIARCLVCEPLLILLDEPFTGIDPITIAEIRQIVLDLRNSGIGILLTDHNVHEALKITSRSYLIKDGKVRTQGTPAQIVRDPVAISEYLGAGFSEATYKYDNVVGEAPVTTPQTVTSAIEQAKLSQTPQAPTPDSPATLEFSRPVAAKPAVSAVQMVLEQEKLLRLVEQLKTAEQPAAAQELAKKGLAAMPTLLNALERRDVDLRQQVVQVMQTILDHPVPFDPYAPEAARKQQLAALRELFERKAG